MATSPERSDIPTNLQYRRSGSNRHGAFAPPDFESFPRALRPSSRASGTGASCLYSERLALSDRCSWPLGGQKGVNPRPRRALLPRPRAGPAPSLSHGRVRPSMDGWLLENKGHIRLLCLQFHAGGPGTPPQRERTLSRSMKGLRSPPRASQGRSMQDRAPEVRKINLPRTPLNKGS